MMASSTQTQKMFRESGCVTTFQSARYNSAPKNAIGMGFQAAIE